MMMLVENDIVLLAKLLSLGDTLNELRQYQQQQQKYNNNIPPSSSFNNLSIKLEENNEDFVDESKDEFKPLNEENKKQKILFLNVKQRKQQKRYPIPPEFGEGITRVYVEEEDEEGENKIKNNEEREGEEEGEGEHPNIQYFSRKNSVLRIPIPPRSSNRAFASRTKQNLLPSTSSNQTSTKIISHQQQKFPSPQISPKEIIKDFIESTLATTEIDSGHSSASEHPSPAPPLINTKEEKQQNSSRFSTLSSSCLSSAPSSLSGCSSRNIFDINSNSNVKNKQKNTEIQRTMGNKDFIKDK
ncbi:unnamed protein product [Meloidogyne enterolobii]|uniref:Uncharacterized protein n=1 Tax=Meloidogyne enterolobii TaxID=390850 RepID=A0ACB0YZU2_MELEN